MRIAPDASLTDGLFDVVLLADLSRARLLSHLPKVFRGSHTKLPFVKSSKPARWKSMPTGNSPSTPTVNRSQNFRSN